MLSKKDSQGQGADMESKLVVFQGKEIRRHEVGGEWFFSVVDIVAALTDSVNPRDYWFKMKIRVTTEDGLELSTICRQLKMKAPDGKMRQTDCANVEGLLRIIQSVPSPKAEPLKRWLAKVGYERIQDMGDPARSLDRAREFWRQHGRSEKMDTAADDGAGDPQQADRLLEGP
jgi:DNA-damage-inducible protein D